MTTRPSALNPLSTSTQQQVVPSTESDQPLPPAPFPDPNIFTILPDLYLLLSRLSILRNPPTSTLLDASATLLASNNSQQQDPQAIQTVTNPLTKTLSGDSHASNNTAGGSLRPVSSAEETIEVKDLPGYVWELKQKIERARSVVGMLADGGRGLGEQEAETRDLRKRIVALRGRWEGLGRVVREGRLGPGGEEMEVVEGG